MAGTGEYRIQSLLKGYPIVGIVTRFPPHAGTGPVILSEPVRIHGGGIWKLTQLLGHEDIYKLSVVNKFEHIGVSQSLCGKIVVATNASVPKDQVWYIRYIKHRDAYTIELQEDKGYGWTASEASPDADITIQPILVGLSEPPHYSDTQLFRLIKLKGE